MATREGIDDRLMQSVISAPRHDRGAGGLPTYVPNWREALFYGRFGEVEVHLVEFPCRWGAKGFRGSTYESNKSHFTMKSAPSN